MIVDAGVDGGQSEIRMAIAGRDGIVTSDGVAHADGDTVGLLVERVADAWSRSREPSDELGRIVLGITTMPSDDATADRLAAAVGDVTGAREVWLCGDAVTAHAGALPDGDGVVMVVGTGIACLAVDARSGATRRVDGDGFLLGDIGAAFWIGRHGVAAALAAFDGRGGPTSMSAAAIEAFGPLSGLAAHVHALDRPINAIAQFAAVVQEHASGGDPAAQRIVANAAAGIVDSVRAGARIVTSRPVRVAVTGRTVSDGSPVRQAVERLLADDHDLVLTRPAGSPLDGACRLAADDLSPAYAPLIHTWRTP